MPMRSFRRARRLIHLGALARRMRARFACGRHSFPGRRGLGFSFTTRSLQRGLLRLLLSKNLGLLARFFLGALTLQFLGTATIGLKQMRLLLIPLLLRLTQFANRVLTLVVDRRFVGDDAALDVGALGAHLDRDRLGGCRATGPAGNLDLADLAPTQRDMGGRRDRLAGVFGLAVGAAQKAQQLHLLGAADDLIRAFEMHTRLGELDQQLVGRDIQHRGEVLDGDFSHVDLLRRFRAAHRGAGACAEHVRASAALLHLLDHRRARGHDQRRRA